MRILIYVSVDPMYKQVVDVILLIFMLPYLNTSFEVIHLENTVPLLGNASANCAKPIICVRSCRYGQYCGFMDENSF